MIHSDLGCYLLILFPSEVFRKDTLTKYDHFLLLYSTFMDELKKYLETDDSLLIKALAPVKFGPDVNYNQNPESLLRNLLNIDVIQPELSEWLLEKLTLVALDYEDKPGDLLMGNVPKLILNHLRWLNVIKNGEKLTEKILEILDATPEKLSIGMKFYLLLNNGEKHPRISPLFSLLQKLSEAYLKFCLTLGMVKLRQNSNQK